MLNAIVGLIGNGGGAAGGDFESIQTVTGNGSATTLSFTSIPSTYKHLQIRWFARSSTSANILIAFNSDTTAANYKAHYLYGSGSAASAGVFTSGDARAIGPATNATNVFSAGVTDILDYTSTNKAKTVRTLCGYDTNSVGDIEFDSLGWFATPAAITQIDLTLVGGYAFQTYSSFALYGIKG